MQGTINGIGERVGNANLVTIIADLQLKLGYELLAPEQLARLTETAHLVDELLNRAPNPAQPYVGKHAFAHKAGLHAAGVRADAQTFEHIDPRLSATIATCSSPSSPGAAPSSRRRARRGSSSTTTSPSASSSASSRSSTRASSSRPPTARSSC